MVLPILRSCIMSKSKSLLNREPCLYGCVTYQYISRMGTSKKPLRLTSAALLAQNF